MEQIKVGDRVKVVSGPKSRIGKTGVVVRINISLIYNDSLNSLQYIGDPAKDNRMLRMDSNYWYMEDYLQPLKLPYTKITEKLYKNNIEKIENG